MTPAIPKRFRLFLIVAAVATALLTIGWQGIQRDQSGGDERADLLRTIRMSDIAVNQNVLLLDAGRLNNYDALTQSLARMQSAIQQLAQRPDASAASGIAAEIAQLQKRLADYAERKAEAVERFKSTNAIYRNSLSYLPGVLEDAIDEANRLNRTLDAHRLEALNRSMHRYLRAPSPERRASFDQHIQTIANASPQSTISPTLVQHARIILQMHEAISTSTGAILPQHIPETVSALQKINEHVAARAAENVRQQRSWVTGITLLLFSMLFLMLGRLRRQAGAMRFQTVHDSLTGLGNRLALHEAVEACIRAGNAHTPARFTLMMLDLNHFKDVNDTLGHHCGDELLKHVALCLRTALPANATLTRLGGDEFALVFPACTTRESARVEVEKVVVALKTPIVLSGMHCIVSASIGISLYPKHGANSSALLRAADVAMYDAKESRLDYTFYEPSQDEHTVKRLALLTELGTAIENNELRLHYQPKLDLASGQVSGVEALVRWQHPVHGLVPPNQFIPLIERGGLIRPLTQWVIEEALRHMQVWNQAGLKMRTAVNISARNLLEPDMPDLVAALLDAFEGCSTCLEFEITETAFLKNPALALETLNRISDYGVHISIDDYGTGYSSLALLNTLPVDVLKIDQSFVTGMLADDAAITIVRSTIDLAHNLGLKVVAEGVEDLATLNRLREMGCDSAQGYYILKPVPFEEITVWLATHGKLPDAVKRALLSPVPDDDQPAVCAVN